MGLVTCPLENANTGSGLGIHFFAFYGFLIVVVQDNNMSFQQPINKLSQGGIKICGIVL